MALRKRNPSSKVTKAEKRLEAMNELDLMHEKRINYGGDQNPLTTTEMSAQIQECRMLINEYNNMLEMADSKSEQIKNTEQKLGEYYTRVLAGAKSIYGVDSDEVKALGGTKRSERKRHAHQL
ncbi:MAG: hypothetical protein IAE90_01355 [Ignavibacteria bacterium]|nr:hypothetical protein [Ignavibacteria bacterium]